MPDINDPKLAQKYNASEFAKKTRTYMDEPKTKPLTGSLIQRLEQAEKIIGSAREAILQADEHITILEKENAALREAVGRKNV